MKKIPKKILGLDFETYFDSEYTLSKMSQTEYIRDKRFKVNGVGYRTNKMKTSKWISDPVKIKTFFDSIDWENTAVLCHHTQFDGLILTHHYGKIPAFYYCSLSLARQLHGATVGGSLNKVAKHYGFGGKVKADSLVATKGIVDPTKEQLRDLGEYCIDDVDDMWGIFNKMVRSFPDSELKLIDHTVRAYVEPWLRVNKKLTKEVHAYELKRKADLMEKLGIEDKTELRSPAKFAKRLREVGVTPPMKISPTTDKPTYAFARNDIEFQNLQTHANPDVQDLVEARMAVQSNQQETKASRLLSHSDGGNLPIYLAYCGAHTMRWSGGDKLNPQNFGRESKLRQAITAPPGHKLVIVDSAQIEARVNAWLAGEDELVEAFRRKEDIYKIFAGEEIYNKDPDDVTKDERFVGKTSILGLGYQMGAAKFKYTLESGAMGPKVTLPEHMYKDTVNSYRKRFSNIRKQWYTMNDLIYSMFTGNTRDYGPLTFWKGYISMPNKLCLYYPNLKPKYDEIKDEYYDFRYGNNKKLYGGLLTENVVQSLARTIVAEQILAVADKYRVVLMVHDEVILCVPTKQAESAFADTMTAFNTPPSWCKSLPVTGDGTISPFYVKP